MDSNLTQEELARLDACTSDEEWRAACDAVKAARDGCYPDDWWPVMKLSGRMDKILAKWGADSRLRIVHIDPKGKETELGN